MNDEPEVASPLREVSPPTNLADLVARHAERTPDAVALVQPGPVRRTLTWAELDAQIDSVGSGLAAHGLVAGHRVAICGPNSIEFVVAYFAALRAGFVVVPLDPRHSDHELRARLDDSGARVVLLDGVRAIAGEDVVPLTPAGLSALAARGTRPISTPRDREALAVLLYTAGTSGEPKAAMLTHRALLAHLDHIDRFGIFTAQTCALAILPLFHVFGLNAVLGSWAMAGGRLVVLDGSAENIFDVVSAEHVDNLPLAPAIIQRLLPDERLAGGLAEVSTVVSGAAPLPRAVREDFTARTGLRIEQGYGLTEAAPGVAATLGGAILGTGHVGRALPGVEIRIGSGSDPSEPDEIWIRGANLFSGYWPDGRGGPGTDGWFATGDIGYLRDGELHLVDRARELIVVNGFHVYPAEVEQVIAEFPGVSDVAVVGRPDPRTGEQVVAFVTGSDLTVDLINEHCALRLAKFKRPRLVKVVDALPRGATGKVRKGELRHGLGMGTTGS